MTRIIIASLLILTGCAPRDCSVGFKGPFYLHTNADDLLCAKIRAAAAPPIVKMARKNRTQACEPPKRWIEVDALADDAGRPSARVCK
jgi:hypothetical protein